MDIFKTLLAPLDKKYCDYFAVLAIFSFILMLLSILTILVAIFNIKIKDLTFYTFLQYFILFISTPLVYLFVYIQNRLLYQMCQR
jgi:hypothetical protein